LILSFSVPKTGRRGAADADDVVESRIDSRPRDERLDEDEEADRRVSPSMGEPRVDSYACGMWAMDAQGEE
jgi:hypothetical protein